jgi:hypothetical protein
MGYIISVGYMISLQWYTALIWEGFGWFRSRYNYMYSEMVVQDYSKNHCSVLRTPRCHSFEFLLRHLLV